MKIFKLSTLGNLEQQISSKPPWRNRLVRSAVNRKVGGSSPPGGATVFHNSVPYIYSFSSTSLILANKLMIIDDKAGRRYFEGSLKFQATLTSVLNMLTKRISLMTEKDIYGADVSQMWGIVLLIFVMLLSPILIILAKNSISSIQLFAGMVNINLNDYHTL